ncbi:T9SS type A sorting domain-containing protein [Cellulophaga sp. L1A9]|uniref:T9SS type A sorting domain-containing protein n=1 Tax=Cellulophaga sp. L1A9 TaxID=2686362 RepID=UPI00131ABB48|nr:T9SS type A sorting domain-containing protein [Cellulophaga sp. L1A9]
MFCYAEYIIKDYSLRYNKHFSSYQFDAASTIMDLGEDKIGTGLIENERIYQAFANAARAGNPNLAVSFNNGRGTVKQNAFPFAGSLWSEDYKFGHPYGGNNNHGDVESGLYDRNYTHITRIMDTDGYVHTGDVATWDDKIVGNFHSKLATSAWGDGPYPGWETEDLIQWTYEALSNGGSIVWSGSFSNIFTENVEWREWAFIQMKAIDDYLCLHLNPNAPNWARAYTVLPDATVGEAYSHTLIEGVDFWDPEGDDISALVAMTDAPSWLIINEDPENSGHWILSGIPTETVEYRYNFELEVTDENAFSGIRDVEIKVNFGDTYISVSGIDLILESTFIQVGETFALPNAIYPSGASNQTMLWTSNDPTVATVSNTGAVMALQEGTVMIIATTEDGAFIDATVVTILNNGETISEEESEVVLAYPNPTNAELTLNGVMNSVVHVYDISGKRLMTTEKIVTESETINLSNYPRGTYLLKVYSLEGIARIKILKE